MTNVKDAEWAGRLALHWRLIRCCLDNPESLRVAASFSACNLQGFKMGPYCGWPKIILRSIADREVAPVLIMIVRI